MIVAKRRRDMARLLTVSPDSRSCNGPGTYDDTAETEREKRRVSKFVEINVIEYI